MGGEGSAQMSGFWEEDLPTAQSRRRFSFSTSAGKRQEQKANMWSWQVASKPTLSHSAPMFGIWTGGAVAVKVHAEQKFPNDRSAHRFHAGAP